MLVYALCGMQMFAGKLGDLRSHFDNIGMALLTVFQVWRALPETMKYSRHCAFAYILCDRVCTWCTRAHTLRTHIHPRTWSTSQITSGENWNDVLYATMEVDPIQGAIFTISMYMIGNYIILNIFVAILLDNFEKVDADPENPYTEPKVRSSEGEAANICDCRQKINVFFVT